tara:strand:- start:307 stop:639 length:333 start_codon:yes stop_codon:yes gene_type:complete
MTFEVIIIGLCCLFLSLSLFLGWKLYQFSLFIIDIEDAIEESLDILNEKYGRMYEIIQKPVFFDSLEVRQVIAEIRDCHGAILNIANRLTRKTGIQSAEIEKENNEAKPI